MVPIWFGSKPFFSIWYFSRKQNGLKFGEAVDEDFFTFVAKGGTVVLAVYLRFRPRFPRKKSAQHCRTSGCLRQWNQKMAKPCSELKTQKRYWNVRRALPMAVVPKNHVRPSRTMIPSATFTWNKMELNLKRLQVTEFCQLISNILETSSKLKPSFHKVASCRSYRSFGVFGVILKNR